jgi:hypothetical protein
MMKRTPKIPKTFEIGDRVIHAVPSMTYGNPGTIVEFCKTRYGEHYWIVEHINPDTGKVWHTPFGQSVLKKVSKNA